MVVGELIAAFQHVMMAYGRGIVSASIVIKQSATVSTEGKYI